MAAVHGGVRDTINLRIVRATEPPVASLTPGIGTSFLPTASINFAATNAVQQVTSGAEALLGNRLKTFVDQSCGVTDSTATATQFEIAIDGLTRREVSEKTVNYLNPGQRSDILVFFPEPGLYCVLDQEGPGENTVIRDEVRKAASFSHWSLYPVGSRSLPPANSPEQRHGCRQQRSSADDP